MEGKHLAARDGRKQLPAALRAMRELSRPWSCRRVCPGLARESMRAYLDDIQRQLEHPSVAPLQDELWEERDARICQPQGRADHAPEDHVRRWIAHAAEHGVAQARARLFFVAPRVGLPRVAGSGNHRNG
jgi:hypothetical protein